MGAKFAIGDIPEIEISPAILSANGRTEAFELRHATSGRTFVAHESRRDLESTGLVRYMLAELINGAPARAVRADSMKHCVEMVLAAVNSESLIKAMPNTNTQPPLSAEAISRRRGANKIRSGALLCIQGEYVRISDVRERLGVAPSEAYKRLKEARAMPGPVTWARLGLPEKTG